MKRFIIALLLMICGLQMQAQSNQQYKLIGKGSVQAKNYYLLTLFEKDKNVKQLFATDKVLSGIANSKIAAIKAGMPSCTNYLCLTQTLKLSDTEIKTIEERLQQLYKPGNVLDMLVEKQLIPSGVYANYREMSPKQLLAKAWEIEANGINHTIAVYAEGVKPGYPNIDSISFNVHTEAYFVRMNKSAAAIVNATKNDKLFFMPSLTAALFFLNDNGRNDAANYEPMEQTVNKAPIIRSKTIDWSKYPYTLLLVPGEGPEEKGVALSNGGKVRCRLAAAQYFKGLAPFIMTSGGKVHPFKTPYCEADEMRKFLIDSLKVPANAVLTEPMARHTTTNMRNGARLIYRYGLPFAKPAIVCTDKLQSAYISTMGERCKKELGYVPYKLGVRISDTEQEFYPAIEALQVNPIEPLDP